MDFYFTFNPLRPNPGHVRDFRKILPLLQKSRFLLLSLRLHTKWVCAFDSPLNFEETGAKKVPSKRHQKVGKFTFFFIKYLVIFKKCSGLKGLIAGLTYIMISTNNFPKLSCFSMNHARSATGSLPPSSPVSLEEIPLTTITTGSPEDTHLHPTCSESAITGSPLLIFGVKRAETSGRNSLSEDSLTVG